MKGSSRITEVLSKQTNPHKQVSKRELSDALHYCVELLATETGEYLECPYCGMKHPQMMETLHKEHVQRCTNEVVHE